MQTRRLFLILTCLLIAAAVAFAVLSTGIFSRSDAGPVAGPPPTPADGRRPAATAPSTDRFGPGERPGSPAWLTIPALGGKVQRIRIYEGWQDAQIDKGIGHFPRSNGPGQVGNYVLAGHRATHGEPFAYLPDLKPGFSAIVETRTGRYTYTLDSKRRVLPTAMWVTSSVPTMPGKSTAEQVLREPSTRMLTLVTCWPRWGSSHRIIWWGRLTAYSPL